MQIQDIGLYEEADFVTRSGKALGLQETHYRIRVVHNGDEILLLNPNRLIVQGETPRIEEVLTLRVFNPVESKEVDYKLRVIEVRRNNRALDEVIFDLPNIPWFLYAQN